MLSCVFSAAEAPLCPVADPGCMDRGAEPGGSWSCTGLTPQHSEHRPHQPAVSCHAAHHLLLGTGGFGLYRDKFSPRCFLQRSGSSDMDGQLSPQSQRSHGRDLPGRSAQCQEGSAAQHPLGLPSLGLKRHEARKGSGNCNVSYGKLCFHIMNLHWGDHCFSYGPSGTSNRANELSM